MSKQKLLYTLFSAVCLTVVLVMTFSAPASILAAVWTDKADYAPAEAVTISGDNSDSAGYLPGETVHVDVLGPNGYASACEGVADAAGAWSCQVTLWDSLLAVGEYAYTAIGLQSLVQQAGTFTDAAGDHCRSSHAQSHRNCKNYCQQRFGDADGGGLIFAEPAYPENVDDAEQRLHSHFQHHWH